MNIYHKIEGKTCIITLLGNLALGNTVECGKYVEQFYENNDVNTILFNFNDVEIIDSSGFGLLIIILKKLEKQSKKLQLSNLNKNCYNSLTTLKLDKVVNIFDSQEDALAQN